jgi:hypothetical protein
LTTCASQYTHSPALQVVFGMLKAESLLQKLESIDESLLYVPRPWLLRVWTDEHAKADIVRSVNRGGDCEVSLLSRIKSCYVTHVKATDS